MTARPAGTALRGASANGRDLLGSQVRHIALEGPIGVGKTTLARRLAARLGAEVLLEAPGDNPFLARFYADQAGWALPTQLSFLLQRVRQARAMVQRDLFAPLLVSDFMVEKDPIFARLTLGADELDLYLQVYEELMGGMPVPDAVVFLHAPVEVLLARIDKRGIEYERRIEPDYLERLCMLYGEFFADYALAPLLVIDTQSVDLGASEAALDGVIAALADLASGSRRIDGAQLLAGR